MRFVTETDLSILADMLEKPVLEETDFSNFLSEYRPEVAAALFAVCRIAFSVSPAQYKSFMNALLEQPFFAKHFNFALNNDQSINLLGDEMVEHIITEFSVSDEIEALSPFDSFGTGLAEIEARELFDVDFRGLLDFREVPDFVLDCALKIVDFSEDQFSLQLETLERQRTSFFDMSDYFGMPESGFLEDHFHFRAEGDIDEIKALEAQYVQCETVIEILSKIKSVLGFNIAYINPVHAL